jgi:hypothetical protein
MMGRLGKRVTCWYGYLRNERGESINQQVEEYKDIFILQIAMNLKTTSKSWVEDDRFVASLYPLLFPIHTQPD